MGFYANEMFKPFEKKVWLSSPTMHGDEIKYVKEAYDTNWMSTVGENINEVERLIAAKVGCKYAVGLSAGTAALHMAAKLAGVKHGDKVICSDMTFSATVNPVAYEGGVPVFVDVVLCIHCIGNVGKRIVLQVVDHGGEFTRFAHVGFLPSVHSVVFLRAAWLRR